MKNVIFISEDIHEMFEIQELINEAMDCIEKYAGITGLMSFSLAVLNSERYSEDVNDFCQEIEYTAHALNDLAQESNKKLLEAQRKYNNLYGVKRDMCHSKEVKTNATR